MDVDKWGWRGGGCKEGESGHMGRLHALIISVVTGQSFSFINAEVQVVIIGVFFALFADQCVYFLQVG